MWVEVGTVSRWRGLALVTCILAVTAAFDWLGLAQTVDRELRGSYLAWGAVARPDGRVVVVQVEPGDLDRPGLGRLLSRLQRARPASVVLVDMDRVFGEPSKDEANVSAVVDTTHLVSDEIIESVDTAANPALHQLLEPWFAPGESTVTMRFARAVPVLDGGEVAAGEIPSTAWGGAYVLLGPTSARHARMFVTAAGPLSGTELVAQTLMATVADHRLLVLPRALVHCVGLLLAGLALWIARRRSVWWAVGAFLGAAVAAVALDYSLYAFANAVLGVSVLVVANLGVALAALYGALQRQASAVEAARARLQEKGVANTDVMGAPSLEDAEGRNKWQRFADRAHSMLGPEYAGILAELPEGGWHIGFRAFVGLEPAAFRERRRDIRRPPYRAAYLTLKPASPERQVFEDNDAVVVPVAHARTLLGIWLVQLPPGVSLDATLRDSCEEIAAAIGREVFQERLRLNRARVAAGATLETRDVLDAIEASAGLREADLQDRAAALEHLPHAVLVASPLGEIRAINACMRERLAHLFPEGIPDRDLRAVVARAEGWELERASAAIREAASGQRVVRLSMAGDVDGKGQSGMYRLSRADTDAGRHVLLLTADDDQRAANQTA